MSEPTVPEDIHGFLRRSIPGYFVVVIGLVPLLLTRKVFTWPEALLGSALGILAGPVLGTIVYRFYYYFFAWPIMINMRYFQEIGQQITTHPDYTAGLIPDERLHFNVSALEDRILFKAENKEYRDRLFFVWSRTHSIGASIIALVIGLAFWIPLMCLLKLTILEYAKVIGLALIIYVVMLLLVRDWGRELDVAEESEYVFVLRNLSLLQREIALVLHTLRSTRR